MEQDLTANEFCRYIYGRVERKEDGVGTDIDLWLSARKKAGDASALSTFFYALDIEKLGKKNCYTILYLTKYWNNQPLIEFFRNKVKERYGLRP